jgi:hypothetical protein
MKKVFTSLAVMSIIFVIGGCNQSSQSQLQSVEIDASVKDFLEQKVPSEKYGFYVLKNAKTFSKDDIQKNGIWVCSKAPEELFASNVYAILYGGGLLSGTVATLDSETDGLSVFKDIQVKVMINITPAGCINAVKEQSPKAIMIFDREHVSEVENELKEVVFK